ncbi:hypothetical protein [Agrobacterium tumefaciens]|uniref:hypothetical protein n=1 Tax=Agrobacterium tumefaciens TaxID=358 RepID=UPI000976F34B|nr:hypothetical protein BV900_27920 [Agrobacterium tumefaciens]
MCLKIRSQLKGWRVPVLGDGLRIQANAVAARGKTAVDRAMIRRQEQGAVWIPMHEDGRFGVAVLVLRVQLKKRMGRLILGRQKKERGIDGSLTMID